MSWTGGVFGSAECVLAPNPNVMTLDGTNTWVLRSGERSIVVDPGPPDAGHLAAAIDCAAVAVGSAERAEVDHAAAAPGPGVPVEWRYADESCKLATVELSEFWQLGDERSGGYGADAGNGCEKVFGMAPNGRGAYACVDIGVDARNVQRGVLDVRA